MTDVQDASASSEPSMEEILASIRRIIADEKDPNAGAAAPEAEAAPEPKEDVLELTQIVQDDGSIGDVREMAPPVLEPEPIPEPPPMSFAPPEPPPPPLPAPMEKAQADALLSNIAASAATSSLSALANTVQIERRAAMHGNTLLGNSGRTLEDLVVEMMKPMLKDWLDEHLPGIVENLVQKEVERIARRVQD